MRGPNGTVRSPGRWSKSPGALIHIAGAAGKEQPHIRKLGHLRGVPMNPLLIILLLILLDANAAAQVEECDQEKSRQEVQRLSTAAVIISTAQFLPNVTAVVDQRWWSRSSLEEKAALARNIDCAVAGPNNIMLRSVIFRSNRDNQELGVYSQNELKLAPTLR
jgi:hypothetical protein